MRTIGDKLSLFVRTAVVTVLVSGAALLLLFGPRANSAFPADCVIVDYWEKWTGIEEAGMRQIVDDFNATVGKEKHIFVRYLSASGVVEKTLIATAGGVPPDVAGLYSQNISQFAAMDGLEPLDALADEYRIKPESYKKAFWDSCHYDGKLFGLVSAAFDVGLYYNTEIFSQRADALRAAGLDPTRPPRTIAELDAYSAALDVTDSAGRLTSAGYLPFEPGWFLNYTCFWFGGSWWDKENERFRFTDPAVVEAFTWVEGYCRRLGQQAVGDFRSGLGNFDSPQNAFLAGTVAMEQQGTFLANFIHTHKPSMDGKWAAAPFPSLRADLPNVTYCQCDMLVIPRGARHKREAFEFIAFVQRQEEIEKLARAHCKISPLASVSEDFLSNHPNAYIRVFDELAASPNAHPTEPIPILSEVDAEMNNFVQKLALLQVTPRQGLQDMQDRLQKKYDDFMTQQAQRKGLARRGK